MSFDVRSTAFGCLAALVILVACGERAAPVDSGHAAGAPPAALRRLEGRQLARDLALREDLTLRLGEAVPRGWASRVAAAAPCRDGSCPDSGYWFAPPLAGGLAGLTAHVGAQRRVHMMQGSFADSVPFDTVLARWTAKYGAPSSESRAPGGDARVLWQDAVTTIELTGTPGTRSRSWFIISDDSGGIRRE